jgi:hypothetical protein
LALFCQYFSASDKETGIKRKNDISGKRLVQILYPIVQTNSQITHDFPFGKTDIEQIRLPTTFRLQINASNAEINYHIHPLLCPAEKFHETASGFHRPDSCYQGETRRGSRRPFQQKRLHLYLGCGKGEDHGIDICSIMVE